jgi:anion-transporting  ArsA/GET3 family ATPase
MLDALLRRRVLFMLGKGGVGKTTLSAAIAWLSARRKGPTLAMESDARAPMAALLGSRASFSPIVVSPDLSVMVLEGGHALDEYLKLVIPSRAIFHAVSSSKLYQYFVHAAPGLRELMMLGKIYYEATAQKKNEPNWNTIVFDAPSSGHALSLLRMPFAAHETFGASVVGREANHIGALLRDPERCAVIAITTPEPMAIAETVESAAELARLEIPLAAVLLNRHNPTYFAPADVTRLKNSSAMRNRAQARYICAVASAGLAQEAETRRALKILQSNVHCPILPLPDFSEFSGPALMARIAAELSTEPRDASAAT